MDLAQILQNIGLSEKEAKIYLELLSLKEALPGVIARRAGIKRPTAYLVLDQLLKKGLVSQIKKGRYTYFQPVNPHSIVEDQYKRFNDLEKSLPKLLSLHEQFSVQPQVSYFQGKEGIIRIMEDTLTTNTELLCWADVTLATKTLLKDYYPSYIAKKVSRKVWLRGIFSYDKIALDVKRRGRKELREVYLIPKEDFPFKNEVNIYDDKVAIISHEDQIGVIIQNKNIADTQRSIFNFAFKYAKTVEDTILSQKDRQFLRNSDLLH